MFVVFGMLLASVVDSHSCHASRSKWVVTDLTSPIRLPPHPELDGDSPIQNQPDTLSPGYQYSNMFDVNYEFIDEFLAMADENARIEQMFQEGQERITLGSIPDIFNLPDDQLPRYGFTTKQEAHVLPCDAADLQRPNNIHSSIPFSNISVQVNDEPNSPTVRETEPVFIQSATDKRQQPFNSRDSDHDSVKSIMAASASLSDHRSQMVQRSSVNLFPAPMPTFILEQNHSDGPSQVRNTSIPARTEPDPSSSPSAQNTLQHTRQPRESVSSWPPTPPMLDSKMYSLQDLEADGRNLTPSSTSDREHRVGNGPDRVSLNPPCRTCKEPVYCCGKICKLQQGVGRPNKTSHDANSLETRSSPSKKIKEKKPPLNPGPNLPAQDTNPLVTRSILENEPDVAHSNCAQYVGSCGEMCNFELGEVCLNESRQFSHSIQSHRIRYDDLEGITSSKNPEPYICAQNITPLSSQQVTHQPPPLAASIAHHEVDKYMIHNAVSGHYYNSIIERDSFGKLDTQQRFGSFSPTQFSQAQPICVPTAAERSKGSSTFETRPLAGAQIPSSRYVSFASQTVWDGQPASSYRHQQAEPRYPFRSEMKNLNHIPAVSLSNLPSRYTDAVDSFPSQQPASKVKYTLDTCVVPQLPQSNNYSNRPRLDDSHHFHPHQLKIFYGYLFVPLTASTDAPEQHYADSGYTIDHNPSSAFQSIASSTMAPSHLSYASVLGSSKRIQPDTDLAPRNSVVDDYSAISLREHDSTEFNGPGRSISLRLGSGVQDSVASGKSVNSRLESLMLTPTLPPDQTTDPSYLSFHEEVPLVPGCESAAALHQATSRRYHSQAVPGNELTAVELSCDDSNLPGDRQRRLDRSNLQENNVLRSINPGLKSVPLNAPSPVVEITDKNRAARMNNKHNLSSVSLRESTHTSLIERKRNVETKRGFSLFKNILGWSRKDKSFVDKADQKTNHQYHR